MCRSAKNFRDQVRVERHQLCQTLSASTLKSLKSLTETVDILSYYYCQVSPPKTVVNLAP